MRKKLLSKTYLRDAIEYDFSFFNHNQDFYLTVKKLKKLPKPFIIKTSGLCIMDDGYYIVELLPKNENYGMRVYLN